MSNIIQYLATKPILSLFSAIFISFGLSRIKIRGFSLGVAWLIISGMILGISAIEVPEIIRTLGVLIFIYAIGIQSGPKILSIFNKSNIRYLWIASIIFFLATAITFLFSKLIGLEKDIFIGIYCGVFGSATSLANLLTSGIGSKATIAYSFAYPVSLILTLVFVSIIIKRYHLEDRPRLDVKFDNPVTVKDEKIVAEMVKLKDGNSTHGIKVPEIEDKYGIVITEIAREGEITLTDNDTTIESGDVVVIEGYESNVKKFEKSVGISGKSSPNLSLSLESRMVLVTNRDLDGKTIGELDIRDKFHCIITRIWRSGMVIAAPESWVEIELGDTLIVFGERPDLDKFTKFSGKHHLFGEIDFLSMSFVIILGLLIGEISIVNPWGGSFKLGIAGATLLIALVVGYFRRIGFIYGQMTPQVRTTMRDLGLSFFMLGVGNQAGIIVKEFSHGEIYLFLTSSLAVSLGFLLIIFFLIIFYRGRKKAATILSIFCGTITSTPAIGLVVERTKSNEFMIPFASVYPLAQVMVILLSQLLISLYSL